MDELTQHTLAIFRHLYQHVSPFIPHELAADFESQIQRQAMSTDATIDTAEAALIPYAKAVWPYRKAFEKILSGYRTALGAQFLEGYLSPKVRRRFESFVSCGGSYTDLHSGNPAAFFSAEERTELCEALVKTKEDLRAYVNQAIHTTDKKRFLELVREHEEALEKIEETLEELGQMAQTVDTDLAQEIGAHSAAIEHGLSFLGPEVSLDAVCDSIPHFLGRRMERKVRV